jgi:hypothetical protein
MTSQTRTARRTGIVVAVVSTAAFVAVSALIKPPVPRVASAAEPRKANISPVSFDGSGELLRPKSYRKWVYVGTPLTPNDMNDGHAAFPEFHSVYVDPESFEHFEKTGTFRDGAGVIKEVISVGTKRATSGRGYFMGDFTGH